MAGTIPKSCYPSLEQAFLSALSSSSAVLLQVWDGGSYAWASRQMMCRNAFYKKQSLSARGALYSVHEDIAVVGLASKPPSRDRTVERIEAPGLPSQEVIGTRLAPLFSPKVLEPAWCQRFQRAPTRNHAADPHSVRGRNTTALPACFNLGMASYTPSTRRLTNRASVSSWLCALALSHPHSLAARACPEKEKECAPVLLPPKVCLIPAVP